MCGLVALIARTNGGFLHADMTAFEQMLIIDTVRGKDSVGCFTKFGNGDVRAIKHGSNPFNLFRSDEWRDFRQATINRGKFIVGHNRAATMGQVNTDNAHPFVEDHIILVHNGTLRSQNNLTEKNTQVDSNAIAHALVEEENDPRHVLDRIDGAFALIWYDSKKDRLYAARNEERPLVLIESDRHFALASETWIAGYPMMRNNLDVKGTTVIEPNKLYEFGRLGEYKVSDFNNTKQSFPHTRYYGTPTSRSSQTTPTRTPSEDDTESFLEGSSDTPEIKALRKQLAEKAIHKFNDIPAQDRWKRKRMQKLLTAALSKGSGEGSKIVSGTVGHTETESQKLTDEDRVKARQASITVASTDFPEGKLILCKILQMTTEPNGRARWAGTCMQPGMEMVDVCGFLPFEVRPAEYGQWYEQLACAKIQFVTHTNNGGFTINVKETRKATYIQAHQVDVPMLYWDHALMSCKCGRCKRSVSPWEIQFTSIKSKGLLNTTKSGKPLNVVEVVCADCIIEAMPKGDYLEDFKKKYFGARAAIALAAKSREEKNAAGTGAVQDRESVSKGTGGGNAKILQLPSKTTLH